MQGGPGHAEEIWSCAEYLARTSPAGAPPGVTPPPFTAIFCAFESRSSCWSADSRKLRFCASYESENLNFQALAASALLAFADVGLRRCSPAPGRASAWP